MNHCIHGKPVHPSYTIDDIVRKHDTSRRSEHSHCFCEQGTNEHGSCTSMSAIPKSELTRIGQLQHDSVTCRNRHSRDHRFRQCRPENRSHRSCGLQQGVQLWVPVSRALKRLLESGPSFRIGPKYEKCRANQCRHRLRQRHQCLNGESITLRIHAPGEPQQLNQTGRGALAIGHVVRTVRSNRIITSMRGGNEYRSRQRLRSIDDLQLKPEQRSCDGMAPWANQVFQEIDLIAHGIGTNATSGERP